ncbi:MAG: glycosyltransferase [Deltaproteobacteria bacterium]|nr:glycosyltransferase [Deltaproteobacteria bacterium]
MRRITRPYTRVARPPPRVGPVSPFRGGIAQHTTRLARELVDRLGASRVAVFSFRRQYPARLFPGESDRDPLAKPLDVGDIRFCIDSLNPWTWRQAARRIAALHPRVVVIPWWTVFWAPCFGYLARRLARSGPDICFLCHNVVEHESARWKQRATRAVLGRGTRFVCHTAEDAANLRAMLPGARPVVHPHPIYDHFPAPTGSLPRRGALELLFFGFVRPYKGLDVLIEALGLLGDNIHLTIAGEFWEGRAEIEARIRQLGLTGRVELVPRYVSDQETAEYFARADVCVLPYRSATGSGVVTVAYHFDTPVVVTAVGGLPEAVVDGETGLLVPPGSPAALAEAIGSMTADRAASMVPAIRELARRMSWASLAAAVLGETPDAADAPLR